MKKYKDTLSLTKEDWEEVFKLKKKFSSGDIVEYSSVIGWEQGELYEVVEFKYDLNNDYVYELKNIISGTVCRGSSTYLNHIGTFIDDTSDLSKIWFCNPQKRGIL